MQPHLLEEPGRTVSAKLMMGIVPWWIVLPSWPGVIIICIGHVDNARAGIDHLILQITGSMSFLFCQLFQIQHKDLQVPAHPISMICAVACGEKAIRLLPDHSQDLKCQRQMALLDDLACLLPGQW